MTTVWWIKTFMPILLRLAFWLHLRKPWSKVSRWLRGEKARKTLFKYQAPGELEAELADFQYRGDPFNGRWDYVSHPEYVEVLIHDPNKPDGDCDDAHWYVANCLKVIPGVTEVYYLSSGFYSENTKKRGGHATAVYRYEGKWYHFDWEIYPLDDPNEAPKKVAQRYTKDPEGEATFWVWETVGETGSDTHEWRPLAICPNVLYSPPRVP